MSGGTVIRITLRAEAGSDALRGVRQVLKTAWRAHRLKCTKLELVAEDAAPSEATDLRSTSCRPDFWDDERSS
jgi:hypothetical protein